MIGQISCRTRAAVALAALGALLAAAPPSSAPGSSTSLRFPTATLTDGTSLIGEVDRDAPVGGIQFFVDAGLDRETFATSGVAALVAECILRTAVPVAPGGPPRGLRDAIATAGGTLTYGVEGRSIHYYLESRPNRLPEFVGLLGQALAAPDFSPATIAAAKASLLARSAETEANALAVGIAMFRRAYYTGMAGDSALGNASVLAGLGSRDAQAFHAMAYRRGAVSATAVGSIDPALGPAVRALVAELPAGAPTVVAVNARRIPEQAPRIVAQRDVNAPWIVVGFAAPGPASHDFGAMLVVQKFLADAFDRDSPTTLGFVEKPIGAFYLTDVAPSSLVVYVNGTQIDPLLALQQLLLVTHSLATQPLGAGPLARYKAAAEGRFLTDTLTLADRSYVLGSLSAQGIRPNAVNAALTALERTTSADVQRVAKTYLQRHIVALVVPRTKRAPGPAH